MESTVTPRPCDVRGLAPAAQDMPHELPVWLWWCGLVLMLAALMVPLLVVDVPPLADYPNHLARAVILAFSAQDLVLQRMFAVRWDLIPNLATDLILPPMMRVVPPLLAGKLVVALTVLLPTTGSIVLSRACFGRLSLWQLGAGFAAYNAMFLIGLLNFQIAVGVALWGAAAWVTISPRRAAVAALIGAVFALVAFVCHLFGFCFFALLISCAELAAIKRRGLRSPAMRRLALGRSMAVTATLFPPLVLYAASPLAPISRHMSWQGTKLKLLLLLVPVLGYSLLLSLMIAVALCVVVLAWVVRHRLRVAPLAWAAVPLLLLAYAVLPVGAKGGYLIDARIPMLLGFMPFATAMPYRLCRRGAIAAALVLSMLAVGQMAYITYVWTGSRQDIADVRHVLASVTPGSRVRMVYGDDGRAPAWRSKIASYLPNAWWHYAAFALIDHRAYWSDAFTVPAQQPVVAQPPYNASGDDGVPDNATALGPYADATTAPDPASSLAGWPGKFDYVLLLHAEAVPYLSTLLPRYLELLDHQGFAALYKVKSR